MAKRSIETEILHAGLTPPRAGDPLHAGPVFAAPFHTPGDPAGAEYSYGRSHNPTWTELERTLALIEGPGCVGVRVFGSGLAAVAAVFGAVLAPGDEVVLQAGGYFAARQLLAERFEAMGVRVREVQTAELTQRLAGARLVWVESPTNPELEIADLAEVVQAARSAGALVAVDNTTATPLGQPVLGMGADFSVCSDSKAMCGHSDLMLGHVAVRNDDWLTKVDRHRTLTGAIAGPMEAWLALRSLSTLPLRLARMSASALAVAEWLSARPEVRRVLYPGLPQHEGHAIAARQMRYFGPVLGFELAGKAQAETFLHRAQLVTECTSFGGATTTAERRARWGHDLIAAGFIRMSVGLEAVADLLEDMAEALDGL